MSLSQAHLCFRLGEAWAALGEPGSGGGGRCPAAGARPAATTLGSAE